MYPLNNIYILYFYIFQIEIRGDAFKLCHIHKRPFGQRVNNIGSWQVFHILLHICFTLIQKFSIKIGFPKVIEMKNTKLLFF